MAEYLMRHNYELSIEEKQSLFADRNRMINIESNFVKMEICQKCKMKEDKEHIYECKYLNKQQNKISFGNICIWVAFTLGSILATRMEQNRLRSNPSAHFS